MPGNGSLGGAFWALLALLSRSRLDLRVAASASLTRLARNASATPATSALRSRALPGLIRRTGLNTMEFAKLVSQRLSSLPVNPAANYEYKIEEMHCARVKSHELFT